MAAKSVDLDFPSVCHIFSYLNFADRQNAELVCRTWRRASLATKLKNFSLKIYFEPFVQISKRGFATVEFSGKIVHRKYPSNALDENNAEILAVNEKFLLFFHQILNFYGEQISVIYLGGVKEDRNGIYPGDYDMYADVRAEIFRDLLQSVRQNCKNVKKFHLSRVALRSGCLTELSLFSNLETLCFHSVTWNCDLQKELNTWQEYTSPICQNLGFGGTSSYLLNSIAEGLTHHDESIDQLQVYGRVFDFMTIDTADRNFFSIFYRVRRISLLLDISGNYKHQSASVPGALCEIFNSGNITKLELTLQWFGTRNAEIFQTLSHLKRKLVEFKLRSFESDTTEQRYCILTNELFDQLINVLSSCDNLSALYFSRCCRGINNFRSIASLTNLRSFGLDTSNAFTEEDLVLFVTQNEYLQHLSLLNCPLINGFGLSRLLHFTTSLQSLQISYCGMVKHSFGYRLIEQHCPSLEYVHLKGHLYWSDSLKAKLMNTLPFAEFKKKNEACMILDKSVINKWQNLPSNFIPTLDNCDFCKNKLNR